MKFSSHKKEAAETKEDANIPGLTPERKKMLELLENDIDALGWDQPNTLYAILEDEEGEDYIQRISQVDGHPADWFEARAVIGMDVHPMVKGLLLASEGWSYPMDVYEAYNGDLESLSSLMRLMPPSQHPNRVEHRNLIAVLREGEGGLAFGLMHRRGESSVEFTIVDGRISDSMKRFLGLDEEFAQRRTIAMDAIKEATSHLNQIMEEAKEKGWDQKQVVMEMINRAPENVREAMMKEMPDDMREWLGLPKKYHD